MPAKGKKNARKRPRKEIEAASKAPPKKRMKKAAPNTDESQHIRRSTRAHRPPQEYWKNNASSLSDRTDVRSSASESSSSENDDDDDEAHDSDASAATDMTFEPQTRSRRNHSSHSPRSTKTSQPKSSSARSKSSNTRNKNTANNQSKKTKTTTTTKSKNNQNEKNAKSSNKRNAAQKEQESEHENEVEVEETPSHEPVSNSNRNHNGNPTSQRSNTQKEEHDEEDDNDDDAVANETNNAHRNTRHAPTYVDAMDMISPHRRHRIDALPATAAIIENSPPSSQHSDSIAFLDDSKLEELQKVLKQSHMYRQKQNEFTNKLEKQLNEFDKFKDKSRVELNKSVESFNTNYHDIKKKTQGNVQQIMQRIEQFSVADNHNNGGNEDGGAGGSGEYKILYETSMKKIKLLNEENTALQSDVRHKNDENAELCKKHAQSLVEVNDERHTEVYALHSKYKLEINELQFQLKCVQDQFQEYRIDKEQRTIINENNLQLSVDNLRRENNALCVELSEFRQRETTMTPNPCMLTPISANIARNGSMDVATAADGGDDGVGDGAGDVAMDREQRIRDSPLNPRVQNELIDIGNMKELETQIENLKQQNSAYEKQLAAKKELVKEFEGLLRNNQLQMNKQETEKETMASQVRNMRKIINLYSILTSTKIDPKIEVIRRASMERTENAMEMEQQHEQEMWKKEQFLCRTVNKQNGSMLEYYLYLGCNDDDDDDDDVGVENEPEKDIANRNRKQQQERALKQIFCDYELISSHNLSVNEKTCLFQQHMTFYTNIAPLWLRKLLQQMFVTTAAGANQS